MAGGIAGAEEDDDELLLAGGEALLVDARLNSDSLFMVVRSKG